jgi:hypothetical protein
MNQINRKGFRGIAAARGGVIAYLAIKQPPEKLFFLDELRWSEVA